MSLSKADFQTGRTLVLTQMCDIYEGMVINAIEFNVPIFLQDSW